MTFPLDILSYGVTLFEYEGLIAAMEEKLLAAKAKNPAADYSDAENKIYLLQKLRNRFMEMHHFTVVIDNQNFKISKQFHIMDEKIKSLQKQIRIEEKAGKF